MEEINECLPDGDYIYKNHRTNVKKKIWTSYMKKKLVYRALKANLPIKLTTQV